MAYQCLTVAGLHSMFSSVMAQEDKKAFCSKQVFYTYLLIWLFILDFLTNWISQTDNCCYSVATV
jgi:hypothetical protein